MQKHISKPSVMARFGIEKCNYSEYGHINVNFNIVETADYQSAPKFAHYDFDLPKTLHGISGLTIQSQTSAEALINGGNQRIYGYQLHLSTTQPALDQDLISSIKAGQRFKKKLDALVEREGYAKDFATYLGYMMRVMNVKYITFESYSEKHHNRRWMNYKISEVPDLVEKCISELAEYAKWNINTDKAA